MSIFIEEVVIDRVVEVADGSNDLILEANKMFPIGRR